MRNRNAVVLWVAAVAYAAAIFALSSQPVPAPAEQAVAVAGDKTLHLLEYGGFAFLLALAIGHIPFPRINARAGILAWVAAALYAASDEFHQTFVAGRTGDVADFAADAVGAAIAVVLYQAWRWRAARSSTLSETSPR